MIRTIIKKISGLSCITGFVYILGIAGMSDLNLIDLKSILIKAIIGIAIMVSGYIGLKANGCME
jgi:hypothetical protein